VSVVVVCIDTVGYVVVYGVPHDVRVGIVGAVGCAGYGGVAGDVLVVILCIVGAVGVCCWWWCWC